MSELLLMHHRTLIELNAVFTENLFGLRRSQVVQDFLGQALKCLVAWVHEQRRQDPSFEQRLADRGGVWPRDRGGDDCGDLFPIQNCRLEPGIVSYLDSWVIESFCECRLNGLRRQTIAMIQQSAATFQS